MERYIRKALPGSLGASIGATVVECFRYSVRLGSLGGIAGLAVEFLLTFAITTLVVAGLIWLWENTLGRGRRRDR